MNKTNHIHRTGLTDMHEQIPYVCTCCSVGLVHVNALCANSASQNISNEFCLLVCHMYNNNNMHLNKFFGKSK